MVDDFPAHRNGPHSKGMLTVIRTGAASSTLAVVRSSSYEKVYHLKIRNYGRSLSCHVI